MGVIGSEKTFTRPAGTLLDMQTSSVVLRVAFSLLGLAALAIGVMIFVLGPSVTAGVFATILGAIAQTPPDVDGLAGPNIDSEMRFYSVLWIAYGALAIWVSRSVTSRVIWLRLMLVVFLLGGVGRVISHVLVGAPHLLFSVLMWIELVLPTIMIGLSYALPRRAKGEAAR